MRSIAAGTALLAQAPADLEVCVGKGYTLTNVKPAAGTSPVTYQWYEDGNLLTGENEATLTIEAGTKAAGTYAYWRMASNAECPDGVPSNTFTVRVLPAPDPPVMAGSSSYCGSGTITATAGDGGTGILWDDGSTLTMRTVNASGTYYAVTTMDEGCESSTVSVSVTVGQPGGLYGPADPTCGCTGSLIACDGYCQEVCCGAKGANKVITLAGTMWASQTKSACISAYPTIGADPPDRTRLECLCRNKESFDFEYDPDLHYWSSTINTGANYFARRFSDCHSTIADAGKQYGAVCIIR
jgi:hypothetical protein